VKPVSNHSLNRFSKDLRNNMTEEECRLWFGFLRNLSVHVRRQKIIGNYIADFYCSKHKLVIELDGSQHYSEEGQEYDRKRNECMTSQGYTVLRFTNADINMRFSAVCEEILAKMKKGEG